MGITTEGKQMALTSKDLRTNLWRDDCALHSFALRRNKRGSNPDLALFTCRGTRRWGNGDGGGGGDEGRLSQLAPMQVSYVFLHVHHLDWNLGFSVSPHFCFARQRVSSENCEAQF